MSFSHWRVDLEGNHCLAVKLFLYVRFERALYRKVRFHTKNLAQAVLDRDGFEQGNPLRSVELRIEIYIGIRPCLATGD